MVQSLESARACREAKDAGAVMLDVRAIDEFEGQGPPGSYHGLGHIPGTNAKKKATQSEAIMSCV